MTDFDKIDTAPESIWHKELIDFGNRDYWDGFRERVERNIKYGEVDVDLDQIQSLLQEKKTKIWAKVFGKSHR